MLKVSDAFNSAFAAPDRELRARVTIGKTVYDSDDLTSINYDSGAMTGEQFSIGSTYMNSTKITFSHLVEGLKQLDEVLLEFGIVKADGTTEYVKMGTFIIDDKIQMDRNNNSTTIECMDRMVMLGGAYKSKLSYPATIKSVAVEIANMAGVRVNDTSFARLPNQSINEPIGYSYRDAIGIIAQFAMGFALFDRDGYLDIRTLVDSEFKINPSQYFLKGLVKNETFFKLNGISCTVVTTSKDENGNETSKTTVLQSGSSSGAQIKLANNVMTQDVLDRMYEALKFTNYYPFSLNWNGNPAVEAGDWLTVEDLQGNEFKVPNMSYTLTYNGGLTATSKADTSVSSPATYSYGGTISNIVNEIGGRESAEGNHIYEGTEDQEPTLSKEGDLWYKHVGPDTEERIYKDGKWEFLTSTKTANDAADAADKASKEAEEAKNQANKAVDGANDAVSKAGFATDTATQAKSDAAAAQKDATGALSDAQKALTNSSSAQADSAQARKDSATAVADAATALTDAKKALTDSSSAMVDSAQARKDSATAIKDAADSLTSAKDAISKVGTLTTSVTSQFTTVDNELKSKVNQTDYDKLKGTVTSQQTDISQNANSIKLKADKSYADTINDSVVKNTSNVGLLNDQIALTVTKTELNNTLSSYATQTWTQSQIKSTADSINLSVSKVQNNLDNLSSGGRNYIKGSDVPIHITGVWHTESNGIVVPNWYVWIPTLIGTASGDWVVSFNIEGLEGHNPTSVTVGFADPKSTANSRAMGDFAVSKTGRVVAKVNLDAIDNSWTSVLIYSNSGQWNGSQNKKANISHYQIEKGNVTSDWKQAPEDMATEAQFSQLQLTVNGIQGTVQNKADQSQVTQLANQISLKADTTALNELKGTVDKQGSEITLNTNSIKLKADQSSVNTLKGTVDKQGSAIDVNTKAIALKANQSTVDTLTGRVSTAEGKITVQADQIAQTVSKTELTSKLNGYATQTWTQSQIKSTADSINLSVTQVKNTVDGLSAGAHNYMLKSKDILDADVKNIIDPNGNAISDGITLNNDVLIGTDCVMSFEAVYTGNSNGTITLQYMNVGDKGWGNLGMLPLKSGKNRFVFKAKSPKITDNSALNKIRILCANVNDGHLIVTKGMYASGNLDAGWSMAPEDMVDDLKFSQLQLTVDGIQGTVATKADKSQVTQLADQITMVVGNSGQVNLAFNSNLESSAGGWNFNKDRWYFSTGIYDVYQGSGSLVYKDYNETGDVWATAFSKSIDVSPGQNISASCQLNRIGNLGAPDGAVYIGVEFYEKEGAPRLSYKTAAMNTASTKWQRLIIDKVTAPDKATIAKLIFQVQKNGWISFSQPMLVKADAVGVYQTNLVSQSQITQLANDINLRVQKGDVVNQINISPEGILIDGKKVHITGQTTIDNAVIKDAMIADVKADKITAGTLNAANVNVINLNANNITTGTIKGANLSMNLNTGEVVFQRGRIHSASNNIDVNIDQGYLSTASGDTRVMLKEGQLQLVQPTIFDNSKDPYLEISNSVGGASFNGANIIARDYLVLANRANAGGYFNNPMGQETFAGLAVGKSDYGGWHETRLGGAERGVIITGGKAFTLWSKLDQSPTIRVGSMDPNRSDRISIEGSYVHIPSAYWRTASGSANVIVARDGALVRSTSASKYKTDIVRTNKSDYGDKLLNLPTATWTDIAETKRYQENPTTQPKPTRNFGMIAEDLADAGLEMLVVRGADGELEGINYDRIGPALIPVIAKLKNEVEILKQQLEAETA